MTGMYFWRKERARDYRVYEMTIAGCPGDCLGMFKTKRAAKRAIERLYRADLQSK
jgi:septal ring-binding cell division protein DamX